MSAVPPAIDTPTVASAITLLAVVAKGVLDHRKGKHRDPVLRDIQRTLKDVEVFMREQLVVNDDHDQRILKNEHRLTGVDGNNGAVGDVRDHENRIRRLEGRPADDQHAGDVGTFRPVRRAP